MSNVHTERRQNNYGSSNIDTERRGEQLWFVKYRYGRDERTIMVRTIMFRQIYIRRDERTIMDSSNIHKERRENNYGSSNIDRERRENNYGS